MYETMHETSTEMYDYTRECWNRQLSFSGSIALLVSSSFSVAIWCKLRTKHTSETGTAAVAVRGRIHVIGGHDGWQVLNTMEVCISETPPRTNLRIRRTKL